MDNQRLALIFSQMADLLDILGGETFRIVSYRRASRALADLNQDVAELAKTGELAEVDGIGKSSLEKVQQYLRTGRIDRYEELLSQVPPDLPGLLIVPGLGPKTIAKLWKEAGVHGLVDLKDKLSNDPDSLAALPSLGAKKVQQLIDALGFLERAGQRALLDEAQAAAQQLLAVVRACPQARRVEVAGSLRRGKESIGDIDLLADAATDQAHCLMGAFTSAANVRRILAAGATKSSVLLAGGLQADLRVVEPGSFGSAWMYFTGSKDHNIRLRDLALRRKLKLNEYGLFEGERRLAGATEQEVYAALGLDWIDPALREDHGEIDAAATHRLPELVSPGQIQGDLHVHTRASDGMLSVEEVIQACRRRGYRYVAITDHSRSQVQAGGLDEQALRRHIKEVRQASERHKDISVLAGAEVDIHKNGGLDYGDDVLAELDFVIAAPHSALAQEGPEGTDRLIRAIEHPLVDCIAHPTGRMIKDRPGIALNVEALARAAAAHGVALEINASPNRLDLRDVHVRIAVEAGAKVAVNTDAHVESDLDFMPYGVLTAQRGWARRQDVLNTMTLRQLKAWLAQRRGRGKGKRKAIPA